MSEKSKLAVFDIDGTIFRKNLHFELINELSWINVFPRKVRDEIVESYTQWLEHKGTYESYRRITSYNVCYTKLLRGEG